MKLTLWDPTDYIKDKDDVFNSLIAEFEEKDSTPETRAHLMEVFYKAYKRWGWK